MSADYTSARSVLAARSVPQIPDAWPFRAVPLDSTEIELTWWEASVESDPNAVLVGYDDAPWCNGWWVRRVSIVERCPCCGDVRTVAGVEPDAVTLEEAMGVAA